MVTIDKKSFSKIGNKILLLIETPFFPFLYPFFSYMMKTPARRKWLYLKTKGFFPFKRLSFYILDKLFEKECAYYSKPSYDGIAGHILDLKYAIAHDYFNHQIFESNYHYSLDSVKRLLDTNILEDVQIIDYGCGAGVMTRLIKKTFPQACVVGLDIRDEVMEYNSILYPEITWSTVSKLDTLSANGIPTILLCNGVINFMTEKEVHDLLSKKLAHIVWFYYTSHENPKEVYERETKPVLIKKHNDVDYNVPLFTKEHGYDFVFDIATMRNGGGVFVYGTSSLR